MHDINEVLILNAEMMTMKRYEAIFTIIYKLSLKTQRHFFFLDNGRNLFIAMIAIFITLYSRFVLGVFRHTSPVPLDCAIEVVAQMR